MIYMTPFHHIKTVLQKGKFYICYLAIMASYIYSLFGSSPAQAAATPVAKICVPGAGIISYNSDIHAYNAGILPYNPDIHAYNADIRRSELTFIREFEGGGFGIVWKGRWRGKDVAIKVLRQQTLNSDVIEEFRNEARIMGSLHHNNIVQYLGMCNEDGHRALIMEFCDKGSLNTWLRTTEAEDWKIRERMCLEISSAIAFLHEKNIQHRDLKSLNVLVTGSLVCKIADFGLAKVKRSTSTLTPTQAGTALWCAPELLKGTSGNSKATDVYSLGLVLWEITSRKYPYEDAPNNDVALFWIRDGKKETIPPDTPEYLAVAIRECWAEADKRPRAEEVERRIRYKEKTSALISDAASAARPASVQYREREKESPAAAAARPAGARRGPDRDAVRLPDGTLAYDARYGTWERGYVSPKTLQAYQLCDTGNHDESHELFIEAAEEGDPEAQLRLYFLYSSKKLKNNRAAIHWLKESAESGYAPAEMELGDYYYFRDYDDMIKFQYGDVGSNSTKQNLRNAKKWYQAAADHGHMLAKFNLANFYYGFGDFSKALTIFQQIVRAGGELGDNTRAKIDDIKDTMKGIEEGDYHYRNVVTRDVDRWLA